MWTKRAVTHNSPPRRSVAADSIDSKICGAGLWGSHKARCVDGRWTILEGGGWAEDDGVVG